VGESEANTLWIGSKITVEREMKWSTMSQTKSTRPSGRSDADYEKRDCSSAGSTIHRSVRGSKTSAEFFEPQGIAVDTHDDVYVADQGKHAIEKRSSTGTLLAQWGGKGSRLGEFDQPTALTIDQGGTVYVADTGNNRVQLLTPR
jgi:hypothetical protein